MHKYIYGRHVTERMACDTIEKTRKRAIDAIRAVESKEERAWFIELFNLVSDNKYARIYYTDGRILDVFKFAYTDTFASFFDVINHKDGIDYSRMPEETSRLEHTYHKFARG